MSKSVFSDCAVVLLIVGLPVTGAVVVGRDLGSLLSFPPPLDLPTDYLKFSWWAATAVLAILSLLIGSWFFSRPKRPPLTARRSSLTGSRFPFYGMAAMVWTLSWWFMAWSDRSALVGVKPYTFFPLWLGFIVSVNAWTEHRGGTCLMRSGPGRWLALFGASAVFWWLFEWLNRFVHNWHYLGVEDYGPWAYALHATLCFSTVLPAVSAVAGALATYPVLVNRVGPGPVWSRLGRRSTGRWLVAAGCLALGLTGAFPTWCYPTLWVAPLLLYLGVSILTGRATFVSEIIRGDWTRAGSWMLAALICGGFWELWNFRSYPQWIYTVPGVDRWHVFAMPLLGYAGYLPFGLECLAVVDRLGKGAAGDKLTADSFSSINQKR